MANKTAARMLMEYFSQQLRLQRDSKFKHTTEEALVDAIDVCRNAIEVEKKQIAYAYNAGHYAASAGTTSEYNKDGNGHYEDTYQNTTI